MEFEPLWVGFSIFSFSRKRKVFTGFKCNHMCTNCIQGHQEFLPFDNSQMFSDLPLYTTFRCKPSSYTLKKQGIMILLKVEGVKLRVFLSYSSGTTSAIFTCCGAHICAFVFGHVTFSCLI